MNRLVGVAVTVLAVAAAGFTGAAYWSGLQTERWYREALAEGSKSPEVTLRLTRYERGLFSSQAVTRVQLVMPEGDDADVPDPSFSVRDEIFHGPLPLAAQGVPGVSMAWGAATVRSALDPDSNAWTRQLARLYGGQDPVVAISQVGFDGTWETRIAMPPLSLEGVEQLHSLKFAGLQARFRGAPHGASLQGTLSVPGIDLVSKPQASEGQPVAGGHVSVRDLAMTVSYRKGPFNFLLGETTFAIAELRGREAGQAAGFVMSNVRMNASASEQNAHQVAGDILIKADSIAAGEWNGTGSLRVGLRNLDGATLGQLQQWQQKLTGRPDDPHALEEWMTLVRSLLRGKPQFVLETQARVTRGEWQGKLTLDFQDFGDVNPFQDPASLLGALQAGLAEVTASRELVQSVLTDMIRGQSLAQARERGEQVDERAVESLTAEQTRQQLEQVVASGLLRLDGGLYSATARFEGGKLFVNGQEIPVTPAPGDEEGAAREGEAPPEANSAAAVATPQH